MMKGYALITGATAGIGSALAVLFARNGWDLILSARNETHLTRLQQQLSAEYQTRVHVIPADLNRADGADRLADQAARAGLAVEILINNAGLGSIGPFAQADPDRQMEMIQVNAAALTRLTRRILPQMVERGHGKILQVSSLAAYTPGPLMAVYYATKAYVSSFSEALSEELKGTGVTVTALCPGGTVTEFQQRAGMPPAPEDDGLPEFLKGRSMSAEQVARIGYRALMAGRRVVIPGGRNQLLYFFSRIFPRHWVTVASGKLNRAILNR